MMARMRGGQGAWVATGIAIGALVAGGAAFAATTINGASIKNRTVAGIKLKSQSVGTVELKNAGVRATDLANGTVTGAKIADGAVAGAKIADGAITAAKLAPGTIPSTSGGWDRTLPSGALLTGAFRYYAQADSGGDTAHAASGSFDYGGHVMPSSLVPNLIPEGGAATTACPGSATAPDATAGNVCLYVASRQSIGYVNMVDPTGAGNGRGYRFDNSTYAATGDGTVGRFGVEVVGSPFGMASNVHGITGVWAARAA